MSTGVIYRVARANAATLRSIVETAIGMPCWTFGGAALWDLDPAKGRENLRAIEPIQAISALDLSGDFGHAFARQAEARWKRIAQDSYDVLILGDTAPAIAGATPLGSEWQTSAPDEMAVLQSGGRPPIGFIYYYAANGAVQFIRYTHLEGGW